MYVLLQRRLDSQLAHVRSVRLHVTCTCDFYEQEFCSRMSYELRYLHGYKNCVSVPVLKSGDTCKHIYTAPSFPVLSVEIRKIKYQFILPDESFVVKDGFICDVAISRSSELIMQNCM